MKDWKFVALWAFIFCLASCEGFEAMYQKAFKRALEAERYGSV